MNRDETTADAITGCPEHLSQAALELVFKTLSADVRAAHVESLVAAGKLKALEGLLVSLTAERVDAALFVEFQPGSVANFWGPSIAANCSANHKQVAVELIESGCILARRNQSELAQTLLVEGASDLNDQYRDAGFAIRAELDYLVSNVQGMAPIANASDLHFAPYAFNQRDVLAELIARTYDGTCDCPQLNGARKMRHVIEGYADAGDSQDRHWYFAHSGASAVGVLLMAEHAAQNQAELVYMGVVPEFRGRGYGLAMARFAQRTTERMGHSRLILAVDAHNKPALDLYARAGFFHWDRRTALLYPLQNEAQ